jgi:hypothetical protein
MRMRDTGALLIVALAASERPSSRGRSASYSRGPHAWALVGAAMVVVVLVGLLDLVRLGSRGDCPWYFGNCRRGLTCNRRRAGDEGTGYLLIDVPGGALRTIGPPPAVSPLTDIALGPDGILWAATPSGIARIAQHRER